MSDNPVRRLRLIGLWEGVSFLLLLFVAMPLKYVGGYSLAVTLAGTVHGFLFIAICVSLVSARESAGWTWMQSAAYVLAALLPFGPFAIDRRMRAAEQALERPGDS